MDNLSWQCAKCKLNLDGNPLMCPKCGYTVYRPIKPANPIADRRQRALETYHDEYLICSGGTGTSRAEAAVEVATQVKITDDIVNAARRASTIGFETPSGIRAAFRAAGFEVVE